jgi:hypothetical protein
VIDLGVAQALWDRHLQGGTRVPQPREEVLLKLVSCAIFALALFAGSARAAVVDTHPQQTKAEDEAERKREEFRVGAFGGLAFPRPLSLEGMMRFDRSLGLGLEYSVLPKQTIGGVDATLWALAADVRAFPFKNGFFVGFAAGHQSLAARMSTELTGQVGISAATWFINPRLGFLQTWSSGLTVGIDAGVQLPLNSTFTSNLPTQIPVAQDVTDVAHLLGKSALPTINLFRFGLLI